MFQYYGKLIHHEEVNPNHMLMVVEAPKIANKAAMGQFVEVRVSDSYEPLLRRPISIHDTDKKQGTISLLYQVKGRGTKLLSEKRPGMNIDLLGPLGRGFTLPADSLQKLLIVGGGIGVAPLLLLSKEAKRQAFNSTMILGYNTKEQILRLDEFREHTSNLQITTMDGSFGEKGLVTIPLERELTAGNYGMIYACGPEAMLESVAALANKYDVPCQVSMESLMGCGVGACLGCSCKTKVEGKEIYQRVCVEGPVFNSREVVWANV